MVQIAGRCGSNLTPRTIPLVPSAGPGRYAGKGAACARHRHLTSTLRHSRTRSQASRWPCITSWPTTRSSRIDAIAELADSLPSRLGPAGAGEPPARERGLRYVEVGQGPPSESIRNVEDNGFRITLRDIQQAPEYAELINECLDEVEGLVADREGGMTRRAGYLFISCPASTTPMHFDVEHSFLLQVKGTKHVSVASFDDDSSPATASSTAISTARSATSRRCRRQAVTTVMGPGVGVYLPSYVPHWVETEAGISVSFSIPFFTAYTERAEGVYANQRAAAQAPPLTEDAGVVHVVDRTKAAVFRSIQKLRGKDDARRRPAGARRARLRTRDAPGPSRASKRESNVYVCVPTSPGIQSGSIRPTGVSR